MIDDPVRGDAMGYMNLSRKQILLVACAILLGAAIRIQPVLSTNPHLPFRTGGLFLEFAHQISANSYRIPTWIPHYSDGGIPFAYPPLPFYVEAILIDTLPISKFIIANLLPPIIAILSLPLFFLLTGRLDLEFRVRLAALIAYATMPSAFLDIIESAGLSEAFGGLSIIFLAIVVLSKRRMDPKLRAIQTGLVWSLCVLASPGGAYASAFMIPALIIVEYRKNPEGKQSLHQSIQFLIIAGAVALTLSCPYWLTVIRRHGIDIFTNSITAQHGSFFTWASNITTALLRFNISKAYFSVFIDGLILAGAAWAILHRKWVVVVLFLCFVFVPREGAWLVSIPASVFAGIAMVKVHDLSGIYYGKRGVMIATAGLGIILLLNAATSLVLFRAEQSDVDWGEIVEAGQWVDEHLPSDSALLVIADDSVREWIPHLARRTVLNVWQGLEWKPTEQKIVGEFNDTLSDCQDLKCIISQFSPLPNDQNTYLFLDCNQLTEPLDLSDDIAQFSEIWKNENVIIGSLVLP